MNRVQISYGNTTRAGGESIDASLVQATEIVDAESNRIEKE